MFCDCRQLVEEATSECTPIADPGIGDIQKSYEAALEIDHGGLSAVGCSRSISKSDINGAAITCSHKFCDLHDIRHSTFDLHSIAFRAICGGRLDSLGSAEMRNADHTQMIYRL